MTNKEKIRAEIEKRYNERDRIGDNIRANVHKSLISFIDSLQEEPVSDDLKKVTELYTLDDSIKPWRNLAKEAFKAGAEWQKQQDHAMLAGMEKMKEQMMGRAIDGDITFDYYGDDDKTYGCITHDSFCLEDFGLKDRDKVKVIVIKED